MTQKSEIFDHLKRHGTITPLQALNNYGCMRLAARIDELRGQGHRIETDLIERGGKRFAMYRYHRSETNAPRT
jgi:hypothetical protein